MRPLITPMEEIKNINLLRQEQIDEIRAQAREEVLAEQAKEAMKQLKAVFKAEQRASLEPEYELVFVTIDVPASADGLLIDGRRYYHGEVVEVPEHMARSIREMMQNAWFAEKLAGNPNMKNYIPPRTDSFSAKEVGLTLKPKQPALSRV